MGIVDGILFAKTVDDILFAEDEGAIRMIWWENDPPPVIPMGLVKGRLRQEAVEKILSLVYRNRLSGRFKPAGQTYKFTHVDPMGHSFDLSSEAQEDWQKDYNIWKTHPIHGLVYPGRHTRWIPDPKEAFDSDPWWQGQFMSRNLNDTTGQRIYRRCKTKSHCEELVNRGLRGKAVPGDVERVFCEICSLCGIMLPRENLSVHLDAHQAFEKVPVGQLKALQKGPDQTLEVNLHHHVV